MGASIRAWPFARSQILSIFRRGNLGGKFVVNSPAVIFSLLGRGGALALRRQVTSGHFAVDTPTAERAIAGPYRRKFCC